MNIAGPCAFESRQQIVDCRSALQATSINTMRASLWKPRTRPGWQGLGAKALLPLFEETLPFGIRPATEVLNKEQAKMAIDALKGFGKDAKLLLWLGSRNQNHFEQEQIAKLVANTPKNVELMFKNQMWEDYRHWLGIFEHLTSAGLLNERIIACHRGFAAKDADNPKSYRNLPNFEMAMKLKEQCAVRMIVDLSHIAGSKEKIKELYDEAKKYDFDGWMLELHPQASKALTDAKQQLSLPEFKRLVNRAKNLSKAA